MSKFENYVAPELEFDENNRATIVTHLGNKYVVKKLSDGEYISAMGSGGQNRNDLAMIAVVSASLVEPAMTRQQVTNNLYDGELMLLFTVISKYYTGVIDFLSAMVPQDE